MSRQQFVATAVAVAMIFAPLPILAETKSASASSRRWGGALMMGIGGAAIAGGAFLLARYAARPNQFVDVRGQAGGVLVGLGAVLGVIGLYLASTDGDGAEAKSKEYDPPAMPMVVNRGCAYRCEQQAHRCGSQVLWWEKEAKLAEQACERKERACRQQCDASQRKAPSASSPASDVPAQPASTPTTAPATRPLTRTHPLQQRAQPAFRLSLAPFVAPTPAGDARYGFALVGQF